MESVEFPRFTGLVRSFLKDRFTEVGKPAIDIVTRNPTTLPTEWIRLDPQGGNPQLYEWRAMMNVYTCGKDEVAAEIMAQQVHAWLIAAAGVDIVVPEGTAKWVRLVRHISGPTPLDNDEDLPNVEIWRSVVTWHIIPVPKG